MEELHNGAPRIEGDEESSEDNEKPPGVDVPPIEDAAISFSELQLSGGIAPEISREDIEYSIKKFEEISRQFEERTCKQDGDEDNERRTSTDEDKSTDGEGDRKHSYEVEHLDQVAVSEEERSKSDGETEDLIRREEPAEEEERSKSDGEKDEQDDRDEDDDTVPLKIQAAAAGKSNKLSVSNCWLKTIPSEIWDLTHLTELDISANYIKKLSKSVANLTLLKKLRLNHNQLSILPKELWTLTRITSLFLNNNNLKTIPKDIRNLTRLKVLDLSSNQIMEVPAKEGVLQVTSLVELRLRNNFITSLPSALTDMTQLQVLWLEGNPLPLPKSLLKKPASLILSYLKGHPQLKKPLDVKPRVLRKSPPLAASKTELNGLADKDLKKRKREQMQEIRKQLEVEKKVKQLEHELMLANAKALKYEEEVRRVEEQKQQQVQEPPQSPVAGTIAPTQQPQSSPNALQFAQLPPHVPRQQGVVMPKDVNYKPYPPNALPANSNPIAAPLNPPQFFEWEIPISELTFGPRIGRGGYGEVYRGMWGGTEVAIKMLFNDNLNPKLLSDLRKEVDLLCKLRHPNIILFMGACTEPETPCIITEYLGRGSMANLLIDESISIDWGLKLQLAIDAARGMAYLHSRNPVIIHRDLKTDNLLVDDNWQVKVADFGLATVKSKTFAKTMCGTTGWVAPEVLNDQGYTEKADVYSFAIILWELFTRQIPYAGKNTMQVVRSVDRGERLPIPDACPADYAELITTCWETDSSKRPSFQEVLQRLEKMRANFLEQKARDQQNQSAPAATTTATSQVASGSDDPMTVDQGQTTAPNHIAPNNSVGNTTIPAVIPDVAGEAPVAADEPMQQRQSVAQNVQIMEGEVPVLTDSSEMC